MSTPARGLGIAILGALPVVVADQVLKGLVTQTFVAGESHVLLPGVLYLTYTRNTAAAFSLFKHLSPLVLVVLMIVVLGIFLVLAWPFLRTRVGIVSAALVIGGALGNLVDRVRLHYVIDFIELRLTRSFVWPIFNFADVGIVVGIGLLLLLLFHSERHPAPAAAPAAPSESESL